MHKLYYEALLTHKDLTEDQRKWLVSHLRLSTNKARTIIMSYKLSVTGRHAVRYNLTLDDIARSGNLSRLKTLYQLPFDKSYPELQLMAENVRKCIRDRINKEYSAIKKLMERGHEGKLLLPSHYDQMGQSAYCDEFKMICLQENTMNHLPSLASFRISIMDAGNIYCFDRDLLVNNFLRGNYNNPMTRKPFDKETLQILISELALEIKMAEGDY